MKTRLLFLQLPIPRLRYAAQAHNLPVAAYALHAYLNAQPLAADLDIRILAPQRLNYASDDTLAQDILHQQPDIIGFSLFCWNIERSLYLADQIKTQSAAGHAPLILAGGPEVTADNPLLHHEAVDLYVYGEGEYTLLTLLSAWQDTGELPRNLPGTLYVEQDVLYVNPPQPQAIDLNAFPSPYTQGLIPRQPWNEMFFETMRGCPFTCRFCYYNKNCGGLRFLRKETVLRLLRYACEHDYESLFLLDPSFNIRPDLNDLLCDMAVVNQGRRVKIATELRADMVDEEQARLLAEAGIYEVELGLQSIHPQTIALAGRTQRISRFLRGTRAMLEAGIETKVDLIVGLPGDSLERFKESARWVRREGLDEYLQVFCLSVLPGTEFRRQAEAVGLKYAPFPPYYLLSSPEWSAQEIREAFSWAEDYFGITFEPDTDEELSLTPQLAPEIGLQELVRVIPGQLPSLSRSTANITKWHIGPIQQAADLFQQIETLQAYTARNPFGVYHVYLELHQEIPLDDLLRFYSAFKPIRRQFLDRDLSVLHIEDTSLFHYSIELLLPATLRHRFSPDYLDEMERAFYIEYLE